MGPIEIVVIVVVVTVVVAVVAAAIVRKLKGKPSACSDCACCPYSKNCNNNVSNACECDATTNNENTNGTV